MTGFLAAFLPRFRLDRCGIETEKLPAVLVAVAQGGERVLTTTPAAAAQNVRVGMTLAEARGHCPSLLVERLDSTAEARDLQELAACLHRFSPDVRVAHPGGVLVQGRPELLGPVREVIVGLGHVVRLVWAPLREAALLLARHGVWDRVLREDELRRAMGDLPLAVLSKPDERLQGPEEHLPIVPEGVLESLLSAGIRTLGSLGSLPASSLVGRFGSVILPAYALARGEEYTVEWMPVLPSEPAERRFEMEFPEPVESLDALMFVLHGLLRDLSRMLEEREEAVTRLRVRLRLESGELVLPVRLGTPGRGADRVFKLLRLRLERVRLESPVVALGVEVAQTCVYRPGQGGLFERAEQSEPLADLVARLQDALGKEAVVRPVLAEKHRPESAWVALPEGDADPAVPSAVKRDPAAVHEPGGEQGLTARPRPSILLPDPLPVRVIVSPSGRPRALGGLSNGAREWVQVMSAEGPERMEGEWWASVSILRDYWVCTLEDGRLAWIFRDGDSDRWLLHGWFDGGRAGGLPAGRSLGRGASGGYAELVCRSNFSFCEGASFPAELVQKAKELGLSGLALTDRDGLYGAVQAHRAAKKLEFPLIHGSLLTVRHGSERRSAAVLVQGRVGWVLGGGGGRACAGSSRRGASRGTTPGSSRRQSPRTIPSHSATGQTRHGRSSRSTDSCREIKG